MAKVSPEVAALIPFFEKFIGRNVEVSFRQHRFSSVLQSVRQATQKDLQNLPERRQRVDGSFYTPVCLLMIFEDGSLAYVAEDCRARLSMDVVVLSVGDTDVRFKGV